MLTSPSTLSGPSSCWRTDKLLSRALRRGCVRMRRIFFGGPITTGSHPRFSASTVVQRTRDDYMRTTLRAGDPHRQLVQGDLFTTSARHSTCKLPLPKTKHG